MLKAVSSHSYNEAGRGLFYISMAMTLGTRIRQVRERARKSQENIADHFGITREAVSQWESGHTRPRTHRLVELARFLGTTLEWLMTESGEMPVADVATVLPISHNRIFVVGEVQAGVWREAMEESPDVRHYIETPEDQRYPGIRRFALRVKGPSMGDVFPDGSIIICVKLMDIGRQPLDGEYVIVQRVRRDGLTEATVKQYVLKDGQVYLWPRSQHPNYQQPLKLTPDGEDEEVLITAIAIRVDRPL